MALIPVTAFPPTIAWAGLNAGQKAAWDSAAPSFTYVDPSGQIIIEDVGQGLMYHLNQNLIDISAAPITVPPGFVGHAAPVFTAGLAIAVGAATFTYSLTAPAGTDGIIIDTVDVGFLTSPTVPSIPSYRPVQKIAIATALGTAGDRYTQLVALLGRAPIVGETLYFIAYYVTIATGIQSDRTAIIPVIVAA
jgi:hypothetical protein